MASAPHASGVIRQFASTARLFSAQEFVQLRQAHVAVVGLGGVGSWAVEALVRSGIGALTLVDMDHVAESNLNRQVQALHSTLGAAKSEALASRIQDIAPDCRVNMVDEFLTPENAAEVMSVGNARQTESKQSARSGPDVWIDATDDLAAKRAMILVMRTGKRLKQLIVSGGAGGKTDPTRIEAADLSQTTQDPLLSTLRYDLRKHHGFPRQGKMHIHTVFSRQPMIRTEDCDPAAKLACAGYGSLVTVTATMGMVAANLAIQAVLRS
ncbi:MAG: tRNA threonylcarbamoyladenosine dehydratase [Burkholderiaceae bacterium]|nr:tRNA threonylcarbamoyladenosine dehydratase [Burkholderiaceae bacterium]